MTGAQQHGTAGGSGGSFRQVVLTRRGAGFLATTQHGASLAFGDASASELSPVELLLAAIGGCASVDVATLTDRRAQADTFEVTIAAEKLRDEMHNHLGPIDVTFRVSFSGENGREADAVLRDALRLSAERLCTVSRTVSLGTPIRMSVAAPMDAAGDS